MIHLATHAQSAQPGWRRPVPLSRLESFIAPRRKRSGRAWPFLSRSLPVTSVPTQAFLPPRARAEGGS